MCRCCLSRLYQWGAPNPVVAMTAATAVVKIFGDFMGIISS